MDLSRSCSTPLTCYFATTEKNHGTETNPGIFCGAVRVALTSGLPRCGFFAMRGKRLCFGGKVKNTFQMTKILLE